VTTLKQYINAAKRLDRKRPDSLSIPVDSGFVNACVLHGGEVYIYETELEEGDNVGEVGVTLTSLDQVEALACYLNRILGLVKEGD
jgi:hypothetical protein